MAKSKARIPSAGSVRPKAHKMIPAPDMAPMLPPPGSAGTPPMVGDMSTGPVPPMHTPNMGPSLTRLGKRGA